MSYDRWVAEQIILGQRSRITMLEEQLDALRAESEELRRGYDVEKTTRGRLMKQKHALRAKLAKAEEAMAIANGELRDALAAIREEKS